MDTQRAYMEIKELFRNSIRREGENYKIITYIYEGHRYIFRKSGNKIDTFAHESSAPYVNELKEVWNRLNRENF